MEIQLYLKKLQEAAQGQDPLAMIQAIQDFYNKIYELGYENGSKLLGLYSTAQQLEKFGLDSQVIKDAVRSHVYAQAEFCPPLWSEIKKSLDSLIEREGKNVSA